MVAVCYWLILLITGTDVLNATLLTAAIAFGLISVAAAGGIRSATGLLNFVLILKFLLIALVLKAFTMQASDSNLQTPRKTCEVMAVGFFALYAGSLLYRNAIKVQGLVRDVTDSRMYLALAIVFSVACLGSSLLLMVFQTSFTEGLSGGIWGVAHQLMTASSFCVVPAMYYAWSSGSKRFLSHPLVLAILTAEVLMGIASTSKEGMMEPLLCYLGVGVIRYGMRSKAIWTIVGVAGFLYVSVLYPYSQYVRDHGGREGSMSERLQIVKEVFFSVSTDADFRSMVESRISTGETYLNKDSLRSVSRLAMIGEADRLIAATDGTQSYTGWETIMYGVKMMVPSFLMADKPSSGGGNLLGHIVGELAPNDMVTQVSYGFMANLYNAFGLNGVLFGTILFISVFYYVLRLWFATPNLEFSPWGSSIWYLLIGMLYEHSLIEAPIGNILPSMVILMSAIVGLIFLARFSVSFFESRQRPLAYQEYR